MQKKNKTHGTLLLKSCKGKAFLPFPPHLPAHFQFFQNTAHIAFASIFPCMFFQTHAQIFISQKQRIGAPVQLRQGKQACRFVIVAFVKTNPSQFFHPRRLLCKYQGEIYTAKKAARFLKKRAA